MDYDFIAGPERPAASVAEQPTAVLTCWLVMRVSTSQDVIVGRRPGTPTWRSTTPVADFQPAERSAITSSGRRYALDGPPADRENDAGLIEFVLEIHGIQGATDVTHLYWAAMQAAVH